jgi:CBS domain-containing protein
VMWVVALGSGTSGGVLAPLLMMGAGLGTVMAAWLPGADASLWPLVCMAAVLAGVLGAPLTATVFAFGLTGDTNALLPLLLACTVSHGLSVLLMRRSIMTERIARRGRHVQREYGVDPQERARVDEVMTRQVQTIPGEVPLPLVESGWFGVAQQHRAFAVVDELGACLGLVDRDRLRRLGNNGGSASDLFVGEALLYALPGETCRAVAQRLSSHGLERLPVVADGLSRRLVGIISRSDLVKPVEAHASEDVLRERMLGWTRR